jgi:DNA polymerase III sliding clamp (beta) subunit (PCNA family)
VKTEISTAALKAALPFAALDRTRYALDGVQITDAGAVIATNGQALIRIQKADAKPATETALLPRHRLEPIARASTGDAIEIETDGTTYAARLKTKLSDETTAPGDLVQGSFPNHENLFGREYTGQIRFSTRVLESLLKAAKVYEKNQITTVITIKTAGHDCGAAFEIANADGDVVDGLIMPVSK